MTLYDMMWYGMVWYDMIWYYWCDMVWHDWIGWIDIFDCLFEYEFEVVNHSPFQIISQKKKYVVNFVDNLVQIFYFMHITFLIM